MDNEDRDFMANRFAETAANCQSVGAHDVAVVLFALAGAVKMGVERELATYCAAFAGEQVKRIDRDAAAPNN